MIAKQILRAVHEVGLTAGISIICAANVNGQSIHPPIGTLLPDPPQVVNSFELQAINDPATGKGAFLFEGHEVPPVVRAVPGGVIQVEYANQMSRKSSEVCVDGPCMNMTNLHFHGLHVSPDAPGDDVLTTMAMPVSGGGGGSHFGGPTGTAPLKLSSGEWTPAGPNWFQRKRWGPGWRKSQPRRRWRGKVNA